MESAGFYCSFDLVSNIETVRSEPASKDSRPALDRLVNDARRRTFDILIVWRLDRLGRNLKQLVTLLEELHAMGVAFVSLHAGIDATTPAGKLQMHILGAIADYAKCAMMRSGPSDRRRIAA